MSYLVTMKVPGDLGVFTKALVERADEFRAVADKARAAGALHHRFGLGDGYVHVIDEWEAINAFESFFNEPTMQAFIGSIGGDTSAPPEMVISEAVSSPDQF
jgi:quinol monooxygenase YgiN